MNDKYTINIPVYTVGTPTFKLKYNLKNLTLFVNKTKSFHELPETYKYIYHGFVFN